MEAPVPAAAAAPEAPAVSAPAPAPTSSATASASASADSGGGSGGGGGGGPHNDIVEECPQPPAFYKLFTTPTALAPPVLSEAARDVAWSSEKQYNGAVTMQLQQQKTTECGQPPEGYKAEMKR